MSPELLAKLQATYDSINAKRESDKQAKTQMSKERKAKLYGTTGVKVYHTESGKLTAIVPTGMTSLKFVKVIDQHGDKLEEFKNDLDKKTLLL